MKPLKLSVKPIDVVNAQCGNRRQCILAHALNRQMGLGGYGHIKVDATGLAYTSNGLRHRFAMNVAAKGFLTEFDRLGEERGSEEAREATLQKLTKGRTFTFPSIGVAPAQTRTPEQTAREGELRRARNAAKRANGEKVRRSSARYVGA